MDEKTEEQIILMQIDALKERSKKAELEATELLEMLEVEYNAGRVSREDYLITKAHSEAAKNATSEIESDLPKH